MKSINKIVLALTMALSISANATDYNTAGGKITNNNRVTENRDATSVRLGSFVLSSKSEVGSAPPDAPSYFVWTGTADPYNLQDKVSWLRNVGNAPLTITGVETSQLPAGASYQGTSCLATPPNGQCYVIVRYVADTVMYVNGTIRTVGADINADMPYVINVIAPVATPSNVIPTVSISDSSVEAGYGKILRFKLKLSNSYQDEVMVIAEPFPGSAKEGLDYLNLYDGLIKFAPGETEKEWFVYTNDDTDILTETMEARLRDCYNCVIGDGTGLGTITPKL